MRRYHWPFILFIAALLVWRLGSGFYTATMTLRPASFNQLPGWKHANQTTSLKTFQISCRTLLRQEPDRPAGGGVLPLHIKDWFAACKAAMLLDTKKVSPDRARRFFERWFTPMAFYKHRPVEGLFTGYYMPLFAGSLTPSAEYPIPVYALPKGTVTVQLSLFGNGFPARRLLGQVSHGELIPLPRRKAINQGAIADKADVLVWLKSRIDRLFLEIQGSGVVALSGGKTLALGYAGGNGAPYTPVGRVLIERGLLTKETASMQTIRQYLESHPEEMQEIIEQNESFVFFKRLKEEIALGAQGVALTPGYSLAVDRGFIPLGMPLWLNTTYPDISGHTRYRLQRLMIAQDTGGAIRGAVRGDVYWGATARAAAIAGRMKNQGVYWLLVPKSESETLNKH